MVLNLCHLAEGLGRSPAICYQWGLLPGICGQEERKAREDKSVISNICHITKSGGFDQCSLRRQAWGLATEAARRPTLLRIEEAVAGAPAATLADSLCRGGSVLSAEGTPDSKLGSPWKIQVPTTPSEILIYLV